MFSWRQQTGRVSWAFTDREGGRSVGEFDSFNLGGHVGDDPEAVEANRGALAAAVDVPRDHLLFMQQCHGADVVVVDGPWAPAGPPPADGVVTATPGLALAVLVADCTPVLLADVAAGVVGAVHAGRPGMTTGIIDVAVARMRELGARELAAVVGPSICARCYEVPEELRAAAAAVAPESSARSWTGTPAIDVAAGVVAQLAANDVAVHWVPGCSREDDRLFSYRRDGRTGRYAGVVLAGAS
ncbi:conserved hypothetical protein [Pedococcus dokdonensis]|uniref:Purine nucleoside phosphorylase n=1 Tax=Pedococcus dokdonensis TaxID=443156 RepID=A0A1H0MKJ6_9MICO|nr:peptidoglycan editing factor PgeF [Pedococcus dokdonensis]SDO80983.1 conserved hypothetical protein [Pedococcus dokdonensis]